MNTIFGQMNQIENILLNARIFIYYESLHDLVRQPIFNHVNEQVHNRITSHITRYFWNKRYKIKII
jgi:hypothetical protein